MAITNDQVVSIIESKKLSPAFVDKEGWIIFTLDSKNSRTRVQVPPQSTLSLAVELANIKLTELQSLQQDRLATRIIKEQQRGRFFHRPKLVNESDGNGGTVQVVKFDIRRSTDNALTPVVDKLSIVEAYTELAKLL